ncbi:MAG: TipAS antibiotic-recognition domain-containing protein [Patescibacteria group bacterium]|nr:TipAS antibiotic-recognition domain-containing protein [Patescibacteria group bacterium]
MEKYYSPEAIEAIKRQGEKLGPEKIKAVEAEWPNLIAEVKSHMERGTDPKDPAVQKLARRWMELVNMFTAGNPEVEKGLSKLYEHEGPALKQQYGAGVPGAEMFGYIQNALGK